MCVCRRAPRRVAPRLAGGVPGPAREVRHHGLVRRHLRLLCRTVPHLCAEHGPGRLLRGIPLRRHPGAHAAASGERAVYQSYDDAVTAGIVFNSSRLLTCIYGRDNDYAIQALLLEIEYCGGHVLTMPIVQVKSDPFTFMLTTFTVLILACYVVCRWSPFV